MCNFLQYQVRIVSRNSSQAEHYQHLCAGLTQGFTVIAIIMTKCSPSSRYGHTPTPCVLYVQVPMKYLATPHRRGCSFPFAQQTMLPAAFFQTKRLEREACILVQAKTANSGSTLLNIIIFAEREVETKRTHGVVGNAQINPLPPRTCNVEWTIPPSAPAENEDRMAAEHALLECTFEGFLDWVSSWRRAQ